MTGEAPGERRLRVLLALGLADVAFAFQQTAVIPAIPTVKHDLHAGPAWSAWLLSGYLVASSVATPVLGKLGDRHGQRRLLTISLAAFLAGSVGAALAPSIGVLIAFRALQGAGGAVFPLSLSIARQWLPRERMARGAAVLTAAFGAGTTLGFVLSGALVQAASWRWIFGAGALAIAVAIVILPLAVPRTGPRNQASLDLRGAGLLTGGIALLLVALTEGVSLGWGDGRVIALLAGGVGGLAIWVWHDARAREPLIDLQALASRPVLLTNAATFTLGYALFGLYFLVPFFVAGDGGHRHGYGFGADPLQTGLYLVPAAVGQLLAGAATDVVAARITSKRAFALGMLLTAGASAWLALLHGDPAEVLAGTAALGLGNGLAIGTASALIAQTAPEGETGIATALNSVVRRVGGGFGGQISAALLAAGTLAAGGRGAGAFVTAFWICAAVSVVGTGLAAAV